jgi:hypothetical protein
MLVYYFAKYSGIKGKSKKGEVHLRTGHEGPEGA